jgi:hypothetical protein
MTDSDKTKALKAAVLDQSVYNVVSQTGDQPAASIVEVLRAAWAPAWAPVKEVVTAESVAASAKRLETRGLVVLGGDLVKILVRDPLTRRGREVGVDYERAQLQIGAR